MQCLYKYVGSPLSDCPPLCCVRTVPEVSKEEGSYASRFYRWFLESFKSCLLLLVALPGLIDTTAQLLAWRSMLWLPMTWRRRYLTQSNFLSTTSLAWSLALHLFCFSQPLRWKEIHTHKHTHTHTHTHIYTHTHTTVNLYNLESPKFSEYGRRLAVENFQMPGTTFPKDFS